jgi:ubiquitin C-terminal hydrolase
VVFFVRSTGLYGKYQWSLLCGALAKKQAHSKMKLDTRLSQYRISGMSRFDLSVNGKASVTYRTEPDIMIRHQAYT